MKPLPLLLLTVFLDMVGIGILIPVIPQLFTNPQSADYILPTGWTVQQGYIMLGILTSLFPFFQFLSAPILGQLSDRYGRKPILSLSIFGTGIGHALFGLGIILANIPILVISRVIDGVTGGNIAIAQAALADITPGKDRAKTFGLLGATFGLGFIIGPFLGGVLSSPEIIPWFNPTIPFYFAAGLSMLNTIGILVFLPETRFSSQKEPFHLLKGLENIQKAWLQPSLRALFGTLFSFESGFTFFTTFFSVYLTSKFGWQEQEIGNFFGYIGLWIVFTQAVVTRLLAGKVKEHTLVYTNLLLMSFIMLSLLLPNQSWQLFCIIPFFAIANGLVHANTSALISRSGSSEIQGELMGISSSVRALAEVTPPILAGISASLFSPSIPLLIAAFLIFCSWCIFSFYPKQA